MSNLLVAARDLLAGGRLMARDLRDRGRQQRLKAQSQGPISPFVRTRSGPAIGLDGQAFLLGLTDWNRDWPPPMKLQRLGAALAARKAGAAS